VRTLASDLGGADVTRPYTGGSFTAARNGRFAYMQASPGAPPALATGTDARDISTLTALSANLLDQRTLGTLGEIDFDSSADGRKIQGWIVKPPHFDAAKKYPLLLEIHGGPFAAYGASFAAPSSNCTPPPVMWSCT
jgi:acylaminoacyl-peptidase